MNHILRNSYVQIKKEFYTIPCVWNFTKEIDKSWFFNLGPQTFSIGFFELIVNVQGFNDDFHINKKVSAFGFIFPSYNLIIL